MKIVKSCDVGFARPGQKRILLVGGVEKSLKMHGRINLKRPLDFFIFFSNPYIMRIIVIGSGLAGLSAALEASNHYVIILEKSDKVGGNSYKASSGINAIWDKNDTTDCFYRDTMKSGEYKNNPKMVKTLVKKSKSAIDFLKNHGIKFNKVVQCGGHKYPRTLKYVSDEPKNIGSIIISKLKDAIDTEPSIHLVKNANVQKIVKDNNRVTGVICNGVTISCDRLIVASGGYAANEKLLQKYINHYQLPTTNNPKTVGDGLKLVKEIGGQIDDIEQVQIHPTGFYGDNKHVFLVPEAIRSAGALLINQDGNRFINELETRDHVTDAIFKNCHQENGRYVGYLLMDDKSVDSFGRSTFDFYLSKGLVKKYRNLQIACSINNINYDNAKKLKMDKDSSSCYLIKITPALHYCMGGIKINEKAQVLSDNNIIENLYAIGETTTGTHGNNRLAGNSLLECVVFGRISVKVNHD